MEVQIISTYHNDDVRYKLFQLTIMMMLDTNFNYNGLFLPTTNITTISNKFYENFMVDEPVIQIKSSKQ